MKNKKLLFSLLALFAALAPSLQAQTSPTPTPITTWAQSYGTGGYDGSGQPVYDTAYAPGSGYDFPVGIAPMPDGGVVVAGQLGLNKLITAGTNRGRTGGAIVRYDRSGRILWQQLLRQNNDASGTIVVSRIERIRTDAAGNIFVGGAKLNSNEADVTAFVAKFSATGALVWENGFSHFASSYPDDGAVGNAPISMDLLPDGGVVVGSMISYIINGNNPVRAPFLAKFNADGSPGFQHQCDAVYGSSGAVITMCRRPDTDGYAVVLGRIENGNNSTVVILTDGVGVPVSQRVLGASPYGGVGVSYITTSADGGFLALSSLDGNNGGGVEVRKLNADLTPVWQKLVRHFGPASILAPTADGGCIISAQVGGAPGSLGDDAVLLTLDGKGNLTSAHQLGGRDAEGVTGDYRGGSVPAACLTTDGGMAFTVSSISYATSPGVLADWWVVKTDAAGKVAGFADTMFDLPLSTFGELDSTEAASVAPSDPFASGTARSIPLTIQPQLVLEDLDAETGINKPIIKTQASSRANLLVNGDAEASAGVSDFNSVLPPSGWQTTSNFTAVQYAASGDSGSLTAAAADTLGGGRNYFAGGPGNAAASAVQTIDVSGMSAIIDQGETAAIAAGQFGGYLAQADSMAMRTEFRNASGAVLGSFTIGNVTPAERGGKTMLIGKNGEAGVPVGTRSIVVTLSATRTEGAYNDGYADNLRVEFTPGPPVHGGLSGITFAVNESDQPTAVQADSVLRFRAVQNSRAAALETHVQSSTDNGATWKNLADGAGGQMSFIPRLNAYVLNSKNYPTSGSVYFRAAEGAGGYGQKASNPVGPFNLTSSVPRIGGPLLFVTTNGEVNPIRFGVKQPDRPSGTSVRIQTSQTPADEASWTDARNVGPDNGYMKQDTGDTNRPADPNQFYVGTDEYPDSEEVYFRALTNAPGYADSLSFAYGPFKFVKDPPATVSITINGVATPNGNDYDEASILASGSFSMQATASSGRFIKRLTLLYDGVTIGHFDDGATTGTISYRTNIPGDHIVEAYATDDLGVTGAAPPVHVRVLPAAPGRVFTMVQTGSWGDPASWSGPGDGEVPGPNDFAIIGSYSVALDADRTVNAFSMNGGTLSGAHTLAVSAFCTVGAGQIRSNLTIPSGSNCELLNDVDIVLTGTLTNGGTLRLHGKAGIAGINKATGQAMRAESVSPDGFFDFIGGIVHSVGKFFVDLAAGGRRGSHKVSTQPAAPAPREGKNVAVAKLEIAAGQFSVARAPLVASGAGNLVAQGAGNLVAQGAGNLVAQGAGNLVAQGAGNLVAQGAGNLVAQGAGNLVAQGAGNLVAQGAGNLVATGAGNLVAQGAGNLVASGAGNFHGPTSTSSMPASITAAPASDAGFVQSGGETDLTGMTINGATEVSGGVLSGSAFIFGDLANDGGFLSPGSNGAGAIGIVGNFSQSANGTTILEDGGAFATQFDRLQVSGTATLGGNLIVNTIGGYKPDAADTFNPIGYSSVSGSFASVSGNAQLTFNADGAIATVNPSVANVPAPKLLNIATRLSVQQGDNALFAGLIVTGPAGSTKKVIIRGLGPSLAVGSPIADPLLELHNPDGSTVVNDNWQQGDTSQIPTGFSPPNEKESVIVATLTVGSAGYGSYTVVMKGAHDEVGVGLVEVYDLDTNSTAQLANIATRGVVQTGDNVLIGGFIVGGAEPAKVLVRATGPSFGASGSFLQDPVLEIHDSNGAVISNDNWRETQESEIRATGVQPTDDREPAIIATLVPGGYTAVVRGSDDSTGIAVVEAYNLQ